MPALGGVAAAVGATASLRLRRRGRGAPRIVRLSSSPDVHWPLDPEDAKTLRQVAIVHRHGTRFPTKPTGRGNLSWPQRAHFWESYKGHLTPVGSKTLMDTGTVLRDRYIKGGEHCLFKGFEKMDGRTIAVYTSNVQRTLQSAWSFLLGLVPDASIFFAFRSERIFSQGLKQAVGVPIYVEDATEGDDRLFHEWKIGDGYKKWLKQNTEQSEFFNTAKDAPEYVALLDKLYDITKEWKLRPEADPLSRLLAAKDVDTQVMIEEAHSRPLLPNIWGEELSPREVELLRKIGDELKRCWFGHAGGDYSRSYGKQGAGYLAHKIWRHLQERADGLCHQRFVQFSCHDTTMCALAAHYGVELPQIGFGAIFVYELHQDAKGDHYVKFYYNRKPDDGASSFANLRPVVLPLGHEPRLKSLDDCPEGSFPLADLAAHSQIPGLEETFESFMKLLGRADIFPTRDSLKALVEDEMHGWLSYEEWHERHLADFQQFDSDNDGLLVKSEVEAALAEWYGVKGLMVDQVFHLLDRDPEKDSLSERDVYLAMCAMVGVRGSISGKSVGGVTLNEASNGDADSEVDARSSGGVTKLMSAANSSDLDRVRDLLRRGADVNAQDDYGWTALRYAVRKKDPAVVKALLRLGADVNQASKSGRTPLMSAVANNNPNVVQILVESGAELHAKNADGLSAFDIASRGMGSSVIRDLVRPKALA